MAGGKIIFMALGGAQEVGASCYFLKLGENNLLLDCGCGSTHGIRFAPQFNAPKIFLLSLRAGGVGRWQTAK